MRAKKGNLIFSINWGKPGSPARAIVEKLREKKVDISHECRRLFYIYYSNKREFRHDKEEMLINEIKLHREKLKAWTKENQRLMNEAEKLDIDTATV